jgi:hypothetical protein
VDRGLETFTTSDDEQRIPSRQLPAAVRARDRKHAPGRPSSRRAPIGLPGPFEWDVKRLGASVEIAARSRGFDRKIGPGS